jgi:NAD(P)H-hydrate epimerase
MTADALALLTPAEMGEADRLAMQSVPGPVLMENAGRAVALEILRRWSRRPVAIACGPGNNGGDGFVVARLLARAGWPVRLGLLGDRARLKGDAAHHAALWEGVVEPLAPDLLEGAGLIVDAIFGAGLARPLDGAARAAVEAMERSPAPVVAVDVPSGVDGATGAVLGAAARAALTVTFFRLKPGHLLMPGRVLCGETVLAPIGIPDAVLETVRPTVFMNAPELWRDRFPRLSPELHKYRRGHALVWGGTMTGAARLAGRAALRAGAGLVTLAAPPETYAVYATSLETVIVMPAAGVEGWRGLLADVRRNAALVGPGAGREAATREAVLAALGAGKRVVLDADALTVFAEDRSTLLGAIAGPCLLTPHEGEFQRLFPLAGGKLAAARRAAAESGAAVLLKGPDTVIAAPDGRAAINANAPPTLATAGTGDVLAGIAVALLAQGMPPFEAGAAAAWLHGEAANRVGRRLVAEDLIGALPEAFAAAERATCE